ncbi:MAG: 2-oxoacid:ferredoxin oxidoreductase subunit beta, partial [Longimicrobiales bacterium]
STKSYAFTRERARAVISADLVVDHDEPTASDLVPIRTEISANYAPGAQLDVKMHDGSIVRLRKIDEDYDPTDRDRAYGYVRAAQTRGEVATGLLFLTTGVPEMHDIENTVDTPLTQLPFEELCPGSERLADLMEEFR